VKGARTAAPDDAAADARLHAGIRGGRERFDPGARLQLLYEPNEDWPPLPDSALIEDFIIDERKGRRMLRVMGSGVPPDEEFAKMLVRLRTGWALAFAQLQMRLRDGTIVDPAQ